MTAGQQRDDVHVLIGVAFALTPSLSTGSPARATCKRNTNAVRLYAAESLQLLGFHGNLLSKSNLASSTLDERHTIRVHRLVERGCARLSAGDRNALVRERPKLHCVTCTEPFDDGSFHGKFDPI